MRRLAWRLETVHLEDGSWPASRNLKLSGSWSQGLRAGIFSDRRKSRPGYIKARLRAVSSTALNRSFENISRCHDCKLREELLRALDCAYYRRFRSLLDRSPSKTRRVDPQLKAWTFIFNDRAVAGRNASQEIRTNKYLHTYLPTYDIRYVSPFEWWSRCLKTDG
jgi:hypothetical protein